MLVVHYHAVDQVAGVTGLTVLPGIGASGVDIFFVLSGFVMWWTTRGRNPAPGDFMLKRLIRIVPLYWLFTLAAAAMALFLPQLLRSTVFDGFHVLMSLLFVPAWHPGMPRGGGTDALWPIVVPGWTLNLEMAFYVLFALTLRTPERMRPWLLATLLLMLFAAARTILRDTPLRFYGTDLLAEFMAGVLLAKGIDRLPRGRAPVWAALFGAALTVLLLMDYARPPLIQSIILGVPALACVLAALQVERAGGLPHSPALSLLGDASYSIYVSHVFVIPALRHAFGLAGFDMAALGGAVFVLVTVAAAGLAGIAIHLTIEKPLLAGVNSVLRRGKRPPAATEFAAR